MVNGRRRKAKNKTDETKAKEEKKKITILGMNVTHCVAIMCMTVMACVRTCSHCLYQIYELILMQPHEAKVL